MSWCAIIIPGIPNRVLKKFEFVIACPAPAPPTGAGEAILGFRKRKNESALLPSTETTRAGGELAKTPFLFVSIFENL